MIRPRTAETAVPARIAAAEAEQQVVGACEHPEAQQFHHEHRVDPEQWNA
jgi:hypothetical protein